MLTNDQISEILDTHTNHYWVGKRLVWVSARPYENEPGTLKVVTVERIRHNGNCHLVERMGN
jgi:hypothetical protein